MAAAPTCLPKVSTGERFHELNKLLAIEFDKLHCQLIKVAREHDELSLLSRQDAQINNDFITDLAADPRSGSAAGKVSLVGSSLSRDAIASPYEDCCEVMAASSSSGSQNGLQMATSRNSAISKADLRSLKATIKGHLNVRPKYDVLLLYKDAGLIQKIAKSGWFEYSTFAIIIANAFWIGLETDYNEAEILVEADPVFIVFENFFCAYFTWELAVRFLAFARKMDSLHDAWFVFDLLLVTFMVLETWVLSLIILSMGPGATADLGGASILRLARLFRLCRLMRVARLLRSMPELFILIKAIMSASRATFFTLCLLTVVLYVYAVLFVQLLKDTDAGNAYFPTVDSAMMSLFLSVALTDNIVQVAHDVANEGALNLLALISAILVATITVMNILIGVLVEAISAVAEHERMSMQIEIVKAVLARIFELDLLRDPHSSISSSDIVQIVHSRDAVLALEDLGIDVVGLVEMSDHIFKGKADNGEDNMLTFEEFMEILIQLRGSNKATVKDIVGLTKFINKVFLSVEELHTQVSDTRAHVQLLQETAAEQGSGVIAALSGHAECAKNEAKSHRCAPQAEWAALELPIFPNTSSYNSGAGWEL